MAGNCRASSSSRHKLGWEDYVALPDDRSRYEILDGKLAVTASPLIRHQRVLLNLCTQLSKHIDYTGGGEVLVAPVEVILDTHTIAIPDLIYVSDQRASIVGEPNIQGAPDLLVEVLSPSTARRDRTVKPRLYARFGVANYWIVDAACRQIYVFEFAHRALHGPARVLDGDGLEAMSVPSGFILDLGELWASAPAL